MNIYDKYPNKLRFLPNCPHTVSVEELEKFEKKYQLNLPPEFKNFYLYYNGCDFHYDKFERIKYEFHKISMFLNKKNKIINTYIKISDFYPLERIKPFNYPGNPTKEPQQIQKNTKDIFEEKRQLYLWFGEAASGSLLIGIQEENFGQIFYWDKIEDEEYNPFWLSGSLFQFIEDCQIFNDNPYKDLRP